MRIDLIGCGCGGESLTREAADAIARADLLIGAERLLREFGGDKPGVAAVTAEAILAAIRGAACEEVCVLYSGDSGFYSGARLLLPLLGDEEVRVMPGIASAQMLAARLGRPWQDWRLCSAHGVDCDPVAAVCGGTPAFFLTGGKTGPAALCRELTAAGLGFLPVTAAEQLGTAAERVISGTAEELARKRFDGLSVLLAEAAPRAPRRTPGLPDADFVRAEKIPMTKQEVRAAALAKLAVKASDVCWDIGAGTGSVSVELALQAKAVWAVERDAAALALASQNREKHGAWNLRLIEGEAPEALKELPKPDAVFIGGSGGRQSEVLCAVHDANPEARVCVTAIALESLHHAYDIMRSLGWEAEVCQIAVSRGKRTGDLTLMLAQNPVFLVTGTRP